MATPTTSAAAPTLDASNGDGTTIADGQSGASKQTMDGKKPLGRGRGKGGKSMVLVGGKKPAARGKAGKSLPAGGKAGGKRHSKALQNNDQGITKPAIRRLARRGGVKRISGDVYTTTRGVLRKFLEKVIHDAITYTEYAQRKTVTAMDITHALKRNGQSLYGFSN